MVKRKITKKAKPKPPPHRPCSQQSCKRVAAYMRREDGELVRYCAHHWVKIVESKKEWARQVVRHAKAEEARRLAATKKKKRIKRRKK